MFVCVAIQRCWSYSTRSYLHCLMCTRHASFTLACSPAFSVLRWCSSTLRPSVASSTCSRETLILSMPYFRSPFDSGSTPSSACSPFSSSSATRHQFSSLLFFHSSFYTTWYRWLKQVSNPHDDTFDANITIASNDNTSCYAKLH